MENIWLALVTGLTTGGISCAAVQGGLLSSALATEEESAGVNLGKKRWKFVAVFLIAKIFAYTLLGFTLGALGSKLVLSPNVQGWLLLFTGLFMLATAGRILNLHPVFRYFVIQPPTFLLRFVRNQTRVKSIFTPAFIGFLTVLIPCGVTQAMMVLAIGTANPLVGAAIMFAFTLGTSPVFFAIGVAAAEALKRKHFAYIAAAFIILIGINTINTGQIMRGSPHTLQNYYKVIVTNESAAQASGGKVAGVKSGVQEATINITSRGYSSDVTTLKAGVPTRLKLVSSNAQGCARAFTIPSLNMSKVLPVNGEETLEFTPQAGILAYNCSMGMYRGQFKVI